MEYERYFAWRQISPEDYASYKLPAYLHQLVRTMPSPRILDFGCGFGQLLSALKSVGVELAEGVDIQPSAIEFCRGRGLQCYDAATEPDFFKDRTGAYDFIIMSHVLEHFPKDQVIQELKRIKKLLKPGGGLVVMVPNAQANTGAYWAYEDFTHHLLFTSGSLYYVLKSAGFNTVEFLDPDCTAHLSPWMRILKKVLLGVYVANLRFWNFVTSSAYHGPSQPIFSYEIKALAR